MVTICSACKGTGEKPSDVDCFLSSHKDYKVTKLQYIFAKRCEDKGLRFLVDFGFDNAEDILWADIMPDDFYDYLFLSDHAQASGVPGRDPFDSIS